MSDIRILIVEDDPLMCAELERTFAADPRFANVVLATSVQGAREAMAQSLTTQQFDIVLLDLQLPDGSGLALIPYARRTQPNLKFLVFTIAADAHNTLKSIELGVDGYVLKDDPAIAERVYVAMSGEAPLDSRITTHLLAKLVKTSVITDLSHREQQTLSGLYRGLSYSGIADELQVSPNTVPSYIKSLYKKLKVTSRSQAVYKGIELGLV